MTLAPLLAHCSRVIRLAILSSLALVSFSGDIVRGGVPLSTAGHSSWVEGDIFIWDDPSTGFPVASVLDPFGRISPGRESVVIQAHAEFSSSRIPVLIVDDAMPAFWAQPAVWNHFLKGPGAYSGFGRDLGPRDWMGRTATDQRAYAFDRGLRNVEAPDPAPSPFVGSITGALSDTGVTLTWTAIAGHAYSIQRSASVLGPFDPARVWVSTFDGTAKLTLQPSLATEFYKVVDVTH